MAANRVLDLVMTKTGAAREAGILRVLETDFDLNYMARSALGKHWNDATPDQRERFLKVAANAEASRLHDAAGQPDLPPLTPLGLVALADELRPKAKETIAAFANLGIQLKIISGDNPQTVAALARQAGSLRGLPVASGRRSGRSAGRRHACSCSWAWSRSVSSFFPWAPTWAWGAATR